MNEILKKAISLRKSGDFEASLDLLIQALVNEPESADLNYHAAWACDCLGKEKQAAPFYEKAIEKGLLDTDLRDALLGLGSTYRCLGEYEKSLSILDRAIEEFPDSKELNVFRTLTLHNLGRYEDSYSELLNILIETTEDKGIKGYAATLKNYSRCLDKLWD